VPLTKGMNSTDHSSAGKSPRILRWLGLGEDEPAPALPRETPPPCPVEPRERRRRQLLEDISSFLMVHRLDVDAHSLTLAHDIITDSDQGLARAIEGRVSAGLPVTLEWLDQAGHGPRTGDSHTALKALMAGFEESLVAFGQTTRNARFAANEAHDALAAQVSELEQVPPQGTVVSQMTALASTLLEQTRRLEQEMKRSEQQTRRLKRRLAEARRLADLDHLTGLPNRRAFETVFQQERNEAFEALEPLCLALVDIDFFKRVNDSHGHETGDRVIRAVGQALSRISDRCHVARHGGEEFVLLFRGLAPNQVFHQIDSARERMAARRFVDRITGKPIGEVTISAGLIDVFQHGDMGHALRAADEALYRAKQAGRNRVEIG